MSSTYSASRSPQEWYRQRNGSNASWLRSKPPGDVTEAGVSPPDKRGEAGEHAGQLMRKSTKWSSHRLAATRTWPELMFHAANTACPSTAGGDVMSAAVWELARRSRESICVSGYVNLLRRAGSPPSRLSASEFAYLPVLVKGLLCQRRFIPPSAWKKLVPRRLLAMF